jgi:hypothetical protein
MPWRDDVKKFLYSAIIPERINIEKVDYKREEGIEIE